MTATKAYRGHLLVEDAEQGPGVLSPDGDFFPMAEEPVRKVGVHVGDPHWAGYRVGGSVGATPARAMKTFVDEGGNA